jgi:cell filamentation protein
MKRDAKRATTVRSKYLANALNEFVPGSRSRVLKNRLGISSVRQLHRVELTAYMKAEAWMIERFRKDQRLSVHDVNSLHRAFLGKIYPWAGEIRSVNISKGGFTFATAYALPQALKDFEVQTLKPNTPCTGGALEEIAKKIAAVHAEFLLLHPYREGNGRTGRLLATLMAYQAGLPGIDFGFVGSRGREFSRYTSAVQSALSGKFELMERIVLRALHRALRRARRRPSL